MQTMFKSNSSLHYAAGAQAKHSWVSCSRYKHWSWSSLLIYLKDWGMEAELNNSPTVVPPHQVW